MVVYPQFPRGTFPSRIVPRGAHVGGYTVPVDPPTPPIDSGPGGGGGGGLAYGGIGGVTYHVYDPKSEDRRHIDTEVDEIVQLVVILGL